MYTAESLTETRMALKLSRRSFSEIAGYSEDYIYMLETGRKPVTLKASEQIKNALNAHYEKNKHIIET